MPTNKSNGVYNKSTLNKDKKDDKQINLETTKYDSSQIVQVLGL